MKAHHRIAIGVAAALSLGLAAASVSAQPFGYGGAGPGCGGMGPGFGPGGPGFGPGMGRGMGRGFGPGASFADPAAAVEGRLAALKAELKIGAQQQNAWDRYAQTLKEQAQSMLAWRTSPDASGSALDRSERFAKHLQERQQSAQKVNAAFKDLYAALTPEQKAIADQRMGPRMASGYGRGPGMRWR